MRREIQTVVGVKNLEAAYGATGWRGASVSGSGPDGVEDGGEADAGFGQLLPNDGSGGALVVVCKAFVEAEDAQRNVRIVGASSNRAGRLDGNVARQAAVGDGLRKGVSLPGPSGEVRGLGLPGAKLRAVFQVEVAGELQRRFAGRHLLGDIVIPDFVEVGAVIFAPKIRLLRGAVEKGNGQAVAAAVVVRGGVQRLMQVGDEMDEKSQGVGAGLRSGAAIAKDTELVREGGGEASGGWWTVRREIARASGARNVNEVPGGGSGQDAAHVIGPRGGIHEWIEAALPAEAGKVRTDRSSRENLKDHRACARVKVRFGDQGDDLMPFASPGVSRRRGSQSPENKQQGTETR